MDTPETQLATPEPTRVQPDAGQDRPAAAPEPGRPTSALMGWLLAALAVALVVVGALLFLRWRGHEALASSTRSMAIPTVQVTSPRSGPATMEIVLPGSLMAFSEAPIFARTTGYVKAWYKDIGAHVNAGDVLAEIQAPDVDAMLGQAKANLSQARANLEIARLNFQREEDLLKRKVVSQQEYDQNRTTYEAMRAAVQAGEANVQDLSAQKGFQSVVAPFPGIVTKRNTDVGALINAGTGNAGSASSGNAGTSNQELFHIERTDILRVFIQVPQVYTPNVTLDTPAYLALEEYPGEKFEGRVAHLSGAIDPTTRTLLVEVQVKNGDGRLLPGSYAQVHLILPIKNPKSVIPVNTILFRTQGTQVGTVDANNIVHLKDISINRDFGTTVEIADGVTPEDRIIVNPSDSLAEGTRVQVQQAQPAPAASASPGSKPGSS